MKIGLIYILKYAIWQYSLVFPSASPIKHAHLMWQQVADLLMNFDYTWMKTHIVSNTKISNPVLVVSS